MYLYSIKLTTFQTNSTGFNATQETYRSRPSKGWKSVGGLKTAKEAIQAKFRGKGRNGTCLTCGTIGIPPQLDELSDYPLLKDTNGTVTCEFNAPAAQDEEFN